MRRLAALLCFLALAACGGGGAASAPAPATALPSPLPPPAVVTPKPFLPSVVVLEGDSLIQVNMLTSWPVNTQLYSPWGATWKNFALGGSTTTQILARYDAVRAVRPVGSAGVFICDGGANDLSYPHGADPATEIYGRLKMIWSQARADGYRVVAFTVHNGGSYISPEFAKAQYARLNAMIRADPSLYDALVENDKLFPDPADKTLLVDGLHYTPLANEKERAAVEAALASLK